MSKTLIIAEKPSVAKDIAAALGVARCGDHYEITDCIVSYCVGHLVEVDVPEAADRTVLPILPAKFGLRPIDRTRDQFKKVKALMNRSDVSRVINACDAGREGEAIFRLTYELAGCNKPIERMWLQTMTKAGIIAAWKNREPGSKYQGMADAARSRMESDWLYGINGSRVLFSQAGRVMTPTLALVVKAYLANTQFASKDYWEVHGTFKTAAGEYIAKWIPNKDDADEEGESSKFTDKSKAEALTSECKGIAPSAVVDTTKPVSNAPPSLYDLTTLQRDANRIFKFSAAKTLTIAQSLYETHKVTSYPRTDSSHLPEDYVGKCQQVVALLGANIATLKPHADRITNAGWVKPTKRIFDNSRISDHFAIIPTGAAPKSLSLDEQKIYDHICKRFLAAFHPNAQYAQTTRITVVNGENFRASGKVLISSGWQEVYGNPPDSKEPALCKYVPNEPVANLGIVTKTCKTKAPALLTEAALLKAMETAGKSLDDKALSDAMKEKGIGTPATRAATIEKLKDAKGKGGAAKEPFIKVDKNFMVPTTKGLMLIAHLQTHYPRLTSATLTGEWEYRLALMEKNQADRTSFMADIRSEVVSMVDTLKAFPPSKRDYATNTPEPCAKKIGACPACKDDVLDLGMKIGCGCGFSVWKTVAGKKLNLKEQKALLERGRTDLISGFTSKAGKKFNAILALDKTTGKVNFEFADRTIN